MVVQGFLSSNELVGMVEGATVNPAEVTFKADFQHAINNSVPHSARSTRKDWTPNGTESHVVNLHSKFPFLMQIIRHFSHD